MRPGDKRKDNNFSQLGQAWIGNTDRGNAFNTRWELVDGGNAVPGAIVSDRDPGATELFIAGTYEENQLMQAEANIYKGGAGIEAGLAIIDEIRNLQGAGLSPLAGNSLTQQQAITQLRSERRVGLLFRNVAFYDARRYGIIDPVANGGGITGAVVVDGTGNVNTNAAIEYNYMDYWHVPDNELANNPPSAGSAPVANPRNN